ncbi:hypothetical protein PFISCL1PPCAC_7941, partial [Pristionchus fissidentatus]
PSSGTVRSATTRDASTGQEACSPPSTSPWDPPDASNYRERKGDDETADPNDTELNIRFDNVSFQFPSRTHSVLENLSFDLSMGKSLALVGTSGCGKST